MFKAKKWLTVGMAVTMAGGVLAGCGADETKEPADGSKDTAIDATQ